MKIQKTSVYKILLPQLGGRFVFFFPRFENHNGLYSKNILFYPYLTQLESSFSLNSSLPFRSTDSSLVLKLLIVISLHTVSDSQYALEAAQTRQSSPYYLAGGRPALASSFPPSLTVPGSPLSFITFQRFPSQGCIQLKEQLVPLCAALYYYNQYYMKTGTIKHILRNKPNK